MEVHIRGHMLRSKRMVQKILYQSHIHRNSGSRAAGCFGDLLLMVEKALTDSGKRSRVQSTQLAIMITF
jgi:hypothetical protein